jgi:hypothetical protein
MDTLGLVYHHRAEPPTLWKLGADLLVQSGSVGCCMLCLPPAYLARRILIQTMHAVLSQGVDSKKKIQDPIPVSWDVQFH